MKPNRKEGGVYMPIAVVSGADRNIGLEIVKQFLQRGWKVFAGRYLMELPLLEAGQGRRICCVTTVQSSNNAACDCADYPAHVSKAPLNMAMNQLFNGLRPKGYTFRMYCKDPAAAPERAGEYAVEYFTRNRSNEPESYKHSDENRLVLRDWMNIEIPW